MANDHTSTLGTMAAGKLLAKAASGRWGPVILIVAGILLLRKRATDRALQRARDGGRMNGRLHAPR